ncbi:nuclear transport factor 2 family protein [Pontibacter akesuensis]|uniref:SnoaL-like domain-containing protein n=1 Tax=Pontibacter akesuensis TaxID=388950 RepID=A0A1I7J412_9BACT|nr:nuclear transport factor 2 family protein [Pontibacter akesuensis]GHA72534.1 hypothetical protein GCM10007389_27870 [Pontibacter akesuensis]SFU79916.1 SnoaL-like domain-containing protein [Pontibacter akesuensis]
MNQEERKRQIIQNYIQAYNAFDVAGMIQDLHPNVIFENRAGGEVTFRTEGISAFRKQAEQAKTYFTERKQQLESIDFRGDVVEASINYCGVLAADLPNGMKAGDELTLQGKSIFYFKDGKIIKLQDIS